MSGKIRYTDEPMEAKVIADFLPPPGRLRKSTHAPRLAYTRRGDKLRMRFADRPAKQRIKAPGGVVLEYDSAGVLVGIVFSQASGRFSEPVHLARPRGAGRKPLYKVG
ncbi:MAG: DUF2283 domain-containing protein [Phycisphaerales bacterium]|jgi:hypothetical protein|nr:DUF2283 domain-containing protein [Phycisphaerales bacterium]